MSTHRLEAFSDGVIAVAITLLVLNITVPPPDRTPDLGSALLRQWPIYAAYATSFLTIGIIWINHHIAISRLRAPDHTILVLNLLLLLTVALLPFATSLMASYLKQGHGEHLAAALYAGAYLAMSLAFSAINVTMLQLRPQLLDPPLSAERRRKILIRALTGVPPYGLAMALAVVSPYVTLAITAALAVFYALPLAAAVER